MLSTKLQVSINCKGLYTNEIDIQFNMEELMKILFDAMGGDNAPEANIRGAVSAIEQINAEIILIGNEKILNEKIKNIYGKNSIEEINNRLKIVNAEEEITMEDSPTKAIKSKKDSSMVVGFNMLKEGKGDVFLSAGNSGALLAGATLLVGRIKGIDRPALAAMLPAFEGRFLLMDAGANTNCKTINILQFAQMASIYLKNTYNIKETTEKIKEQTIINDTDKPEETLQEIQTYLNQGIKTYLNQENTILYSNNKLETDKIQKEQIAIERIKTEKIASENIEADSIKIDKITTEEIDENLEKTQIKNIENISFEKLTNGKIGTNDIKSYNEESDKINKNKTCSNDEVLDNKCGNGIIELNQVKELFNQFSNNIIYFGYGDERMKIIETGNVIFQIIYLNENDIGLNPNVSFVNIGECEKILKSVYNISESESLIMVKSDSKKTEEPTTVFFDLYHPKTRTKLNMSYCYDVQIKINIPTQLENNTIELYESLLDSGYNIFDSNDPFYNDACSLYTSKNGTDMILSDRQNIIYAQAGNISLCQSGCKFISYNKTLKTAECGCDVKSTSAESSSEESDKKDFKDSFLSTLLNSNFLILKCFKLVFSAKHIFSNEGKIIMTIIIFFYIVISVIYFINDKKNINKYFQLILQDKIERDKNNQDKNKEDDHSNISFQEKSKIDQNAKNNIIGKHQIINVENMNKIKSQKQSYIFNTKNQFPPKKLKIKKNPKKITSNNSNNKIFPINFFNIIIKKSDAEITKINEISERKLIERQKVIEKQKIIDLKEKKENNLENKAIKETNESEIDYEMNDDELNSLEYEKALKYDKRTFFQYYWSLLKKEQLILFTFLPTNDYNLVSLKLALFVVSLSLEITINGFFFTDETMHQIHQNEGEFDLLYQIPQILYSTIISDIINYVLQKLALSEDSLLTLKKIKNFDKAKKQYESIYRCLKIKFVVFIIISFLLIFFCWYYISSFCAVYVNTQSILFKDTLIGLLLSMAYPFGLCLLPGLC